MVSPGELRRAVAAALAVQEPTVVVHDRNLRDAGLRSVKGRGRRGAPQMSARDVAHLLTAILGSALVKDSVQSVKRYTETRPYWSRSSDNAFAELGIDELAALPREHSFIDGLEALIRSAASGTLIRQVLDPAEGTTRPGIPVAPIIEITALTPGTAGDIHIAGLKHGRTATVRYALPNPWGGRSSRKPSAREVAAWEAKMKEYPSAPGMEQFRRISAREVLLIAELLRADTERA